MSSGNLCWWELSTSFSQSLLQVGQFGLPAISSNASLCDQGQQLKPKRFQLKVAAKCSGGAEMHPLFQHCQQGGNFLPRGGVHSCRQKAFMFPWPELPRFVLQIAIPSQSLGCWLPELLTGTTCTTKCLESTSRGPANATAWFALLC